MSNVFSPYGNPTNPLVRTLIHTKSTATTPPSTSTKNLMNKEESNYYVMTFPYWLPRFIADMHLTPQSVVILPGENDCLVLDA
jgi:hypothetical protein